MDVSELGDHLRSSPAHRQARPAHRRPGRRHGLKVGDAIEMEVEDFVAPQYGEDGPIKTARTARLFCFALGYLLVWASSGLAAYGLALGAGWAARAGSWIGPVTASTIFAINGVYQLSDWKSRCLSRCRSPIGLLLKYGGFRGPARNLLAGAHNAAYCLDAAGPSWP